MKTATEIFATNEYSMFKYLNGNRDVSEDRVRSIMKSIDKVGYIMNPIIVNEKNEVIDGQGRLEALKRLSLPVHYIIVPGSGINECIAMNIDQKNWKIEDYIKSYTDVGNSSYIRLSQLIVKYGDYLKLRTILAVAYGRECSYSIVKSGEFTLEPEQMREVMDILDYLKKVAYIFSQVGGRIESYYTALIFCYKYNGIDNQLMLEKLNNNRAELIPVSKTDQAFDVIEAIYNKRLRSKIYIKTEYKKAMDEKYFWYGSKHLGKQHKC